MNAWAEILNTVDNKGQAFFKCLQQPRQVQESVLKKILQSNSATRFGQQHNFNVISSISDYQASVPVHTYEDMQDYICCISEGEQEVLTAEQVVVFEQTGGSSSGAKLIPYTKSALRAFQDGLYPWLYDLLSHREGIKQGSAYWSISPVFRENQMTPAGIPLGLANDAEYFGMALAAHIINTLAVPPVVGEATSLASWQYLTLRYLLASRNLTLISVWSPTFLLDLMSALSEQYPLIIEDVLNNTTRYPLPDGAGDVDISHLQFDETRIEEIEQAFNGNSIDTHKLWPELDTISCWLDEGASRYREKLEALFPDVYLQAKGLLATEGVISIPVCHPDHSDYFDGAVLALKSAFFEFVDAEENIYLAHELKTGERYRVLITNWSGFYRYDIGDQVLVTGYLDKTPLVKFVGRRGAVSDLCGEKLTESFVLAQLYDVSSDVMLLPCLNEKAGYILLLEQAYYNNAEAEKLAGIIEQRLCGNPQYAYAREIGQLVPLTALLIDNIWKHYTRYECSKGRNLGDIKPAVLCKDSGFYKYLTDDNTLLRQEAR